MDAPRGDELAPPEGFDRHQRQAWWVSWKLARAALMTSTGTCARDWLRTPERDGRRMTLSEIRAEYRKVREECAEETALATEKFDDECAALLSRRQLDLTCAGYWLWAAHRVDQSNRQRVIERRKAARARW